MRWMSIALAALFLLAGCVIVPTETDRDDDGISNSVDNCPDLYNPDQRDENHDGVGDACEGDITFYWSFGGHNCSQSPEVAKVHVALTGPGGEQTLEDDGYYKCSPNGVDGIKLTNFVLGSYTFTINALDLANVTLYTTTGTVRVTGHSDPSVTVDLAPVSSDGTAQLFWQFRDVNNAIVTCANTGISDATPVTKVRVYINNQTPEDLQCTQNDQYGKPVQGWSWNLPAGSYQVTMDGIVDRGGGKEELWYSSTQTVTVISNQVKNVTFDLYPVASGATFKPKLIDSAGLGYANCAEAGVQAFSFKLVNYDTPPVVYDYLDSNCDTVMSLGLHWGYMPVFQTWDVAAGKWMGDWTVTVNALDAANTVVGTKTETTRLYAGNKDWLFPINVVR